MSLYLRLILEKETAYNNHKDKNSKSIHVDKCKNVIPLIITRKGLSEIIIYIRTEFLT